jgi:hypothetical protein
MPSFVSDTTGVQRRSFTPYEGPEPTKGFYRARITKLVVRKAKNTDSLMFHIVAAFEASPNRPENAKYNDYPAFVYLTLGEHDSLKEREQNLILALTGKTKAKIDTEADVKKLKRGEETKVTKVDGKDPVGKYVLVEMRPEVDEREGQGGVTRMRADGVFPTRDQNAYAGSKVAGSPTDDVEDEDVEEDEEAEEYTKEELTAKSLAALRKILVEEFDFDTDVAAGIKKKAELVEEILDQQSDALGDDEDEDEDEELEDEDLEDEDEELDEDEEEADEDDVEGRIDEELAGMDRNAVKAQLKKRTPERKFKTSETDEALKAELKELMLQDPPF